jgi:hypothetical protein
MKRVIQSGRRDWHICSLSNSGPNFGAGRGISEFFLGVPGAAECRKVFNYSAQRELSYWLERLWPRHEPN